MIYIPRRETVRCNRASYRSAVAVLVTPPGIPFYDNMISVCQHIDYA